MVYTAIIVYQSVNNFVLFKSKPFLSLYVIYAIYVINSVFRHIRYIYEHASMSVVVLVLILGSCHNKARLTYIVVEKRMVKNCSIFRLKISDISSIRYKMSLLTNNPSLSQPTLLYSRDLKG